MQLMPFMYLWLIFLQDGVLVDDMYIESLIHITACIAFDNLVEQFLHLF